MTRPVMITGVGGQLGREVLRAMPHGTNVLPLESAALDITDARAVNALVTVQQPAVIINCAAYTAVDRAEQEPERVYAVNATATGHLATAAAAVDARMIHVSTDFVFGASHGAPWRPDDPTLALSVYGAAKLAGERNVLAVAGLRSLVLRTSWLHASRGQNFVHTMLRLMREREAVHVVSDQVGTPTWAGSLARTIWAAVEQPAASGILHWTDAGVASWYDFAVAIQEEAIARGLLTRGVPIHAIATSHYPTPARRPTYSVLDTSETTRLLGVTAVHWRVNLRRMLDELANA